MYKRQVVEIHHQAIAVIAARSQQKALGSNAVLHVQHDAQICLLYTSDAADERSSVDLGGRRIIKKKNKRKIRGRGDRNKSHKLMCR